MLRATDLFPPLTIAPAHASSPATDSKEQRKPGSALVPTEALLESGIGKERVAQGADSSPLALRVISMSNRLRLVRVIRPHWNMISL